VRLIAASGTPHEIGHAIGSSSADLVGRAVELICRFELDDHERKRRLADIERLLTESFPNVLEEAEGLAAGAGISRRDALELSVCSDLSGKLPAWCSLLAVPGPAGLLVGKNLDTTLEMAPLQVLERIEPATGLGYIHVTTAGAMWTDGGVNDAGLALVNASVAAGRVDERGLPDGVLVRELLARCADVGEAIELASAHEVRTLGENVVVGDASGQVAVIEKLPGAQAVHRGHSAAACNHVRSPELEPAIDAEDSIRENSVRRLERLEEARATGEAWTVERLGAVIAAREGGVYQDGSGGIQTIASVILAPGERRLWLDDSGSGDAVFYEVTKETNGGWARADQGQEEQKHVDIR
jgi:predicted choloylglycine hydrolase